MKNLNYFQVTWGTAPNVKIHTFMVEPNTEGNYETMTYCKTIRGAELAAKRLAACHVDSTIHQNIRRLIPFPTDANMIKLYNKDGNDG